MKKTLFAMFAAALMMTGCSSDLEPEVRTDGNTHFTVQLPDGMGSRAFGDGETATNLTVVAYEAGTKTIGDKATATFTSKATTVDLTLERGKRYDIVFWAVAPGADCYTFSDTDGSVTVDYTKVNGSDDNADAFFACDNTPVISESYTKTVQLRRPLAQVNLGTDDLKADWSVKTTMTAKAYTTLSLVDGAVSNQTDVTFVTDAQPTGETFPVTHDNTEKTYSYLAMAYLLVPEAQELVDINFSMERTGAEVVTIPVANAPVQRNYRTNVFGSLLTANGNYNVVIVPDFYTPNAADIKWDGSVDKNLTEVEDEIMIYTAAQLAGFAELVNDGETYEGKTVKLANDIDLANRYWTPIGFIQKYTNTVRVPFKGTFDGNGKTISNLMVSAKEGGSVNSAGLFGCLDNATIKNLKVANATVTSNHYAGTICGWATNAATFNGCTVDNARVTSTYADDDNSGDKAGGLVGYVQDGCAITSCTVSNSEVKAARDLGGIVGMLEVSSGYGNEQRPSTATNCTIKDVKLTITSNKRTVKAIAGRLNASCTQGTGHNVDGITLRFENFDATGTNDYQSILYLNYEGTGWKNIAVEIVNVKTNGVYVNTRGGNAATLLVDGCEIHNFEGQYEYCKSSNSDSDKDKRVLGAHLGINFLTSPGITLENKFTMRNTNIYDTYGHNIQIWDGTDASPYSNDGHVDILIENSSFANWGMKEEAENDIRTSAAIKVTGDKDIIAAVNTFRSMLYSGGNTFTIPADKNGFQYTVINITNCETQKARCSRSALDDDWVELDK